MLAAFLKCIGFIIPLMDAEHAYYYTREVRGGKHFVGGGCLVGSMCIGTQNAFDATDSVCACVCKTGRVWLASSRGPLC